MPVLQSVQQLKDVTPSLTTRVSETLFSICNNRRYKADERTRHEHLPTVRPDLEADGVQGQQPGPGCCLLRSWLFRLRSCHSERHDDFDLDKHIIPKQLFHWCC